MGVARGATLAGQTNGVRALAVRLVHSESSRRTSTFDELKVLATPESPDPVSEAETLIEIEEASEAPGTKRSLLSAAVYSLGFTVQRAIGLLMLPVYTAVLSPDEYGALGLLVAAYLGVGILLAVGLDTAIVRNYFQLADRPDEQQAFLDSIWRFLLLFPAAASVVLTVGAWPFLGANGSITGVEVALMLFSAALNVAATTLPLAVLRARQDLRGYLWMSAVLAACTTGLTVVFVVALDQGIRGWFLATLLSNLALLAVALRVVPWNWKGKLEWPVVSAAVLFSLPLVPHFVSHWALQLADRGVIAGMVSGAELGIYTLAANLASVVMMLVMALNQAFSPTYARAGAQPGLEQELREVVVLQISAVVALTLGAALLGPSVIELVTGPEYHEASGLVPWLVIGYGFLGIYFVPMNGATLGAGRRTYAWVATVFSAAINIGLLYAFVPKHGVHAAAVASAVGYLVLLVSLGTWAHSGENVVRYDWRRIGPIILLAGIVFALAGWSTPSTPLAEFGAHLAWFVVFAASVAALTLRKQFSQRLRRTT